MIHEAGYRQGQCEVCWREDIDNIPPPAEPRRSFDHAGVLFDRVSVLVAMRGLR